MADAQLSYVLEDNLRRVSHNLFFLFIVVRSRLIRFLARRDQNCSAGAIIIGSELDSFNVVNRGPRMPKTLRPKLLGGLQPEGSTKTQQLKLV